MLFNIASFNGHNRQLFGIVLTRRLRCVGWYEEGNWRIGIDSTKSTCGLRHNTTSGNSYVDYHTTAVTGIGYRQHVRATDGGKNVASIRYRTYQNTKSSQPKKFLAIRPKSKQVVTRRVSEHEKVQQVAALQNNESSSVYLKVVGSGAVGGSRSLYVSSGSNSYLFNCGEGTLRLALEHKVDLLNVEHILVTHKSWKNVGGLLGTLLTLRNSGVPRVTLHGPPGIASLCSDVFHFIQFRELGVQYQHFRESNGACGRGSDALIIHSVPLWAKPHQSEDEKNIRGTSASMGKVLHPYKKPAHTRSDLANKKINEVGTQKPDESIKCRNLAVAYICRLPSKVGKLQWGKCVSAGVPPGPLVRVLKNGQDVTLPSGRIVRAADVISPDYPGAVFIAVEAPSDVYLDALLDSPAFPQYQAAAGCDTDKAEVVVHFTPHDVMSDTRYQMWMSRFSASTTHIVINDASSCLGLVGVHAIQYKLNCLSDTLFPLLKDSSIPVVEENITAEETAINERDFSENGSFKKDNHKIRSELHHCRITSSVFQASTNLTYHVRPEKKIDRSKEPVLHPELYIKNCYDQDRFEAALRHAENSLQEPERHKFPNCTSESYPNVTFLGTGSSQPSATRNNTSILLSLSDEKTLIMDCGEGTYGQLVRLLGVAETDHVLRTLAAVYISHIHADHHTGFIQLLLARRQAFHQAGIYNVPKLFCLAPPKIMKYLTSYDRNFEYILNDFTFIDNNKLLVNDFKLDKRTHHDLCSQLGMKSISLTKVIHCPNAFGVAWTHNNGWKLVYSGDTMPCRDLIDIGRNCDLLIHEATVDDGMEEFAIFKAHSTTSQAIQVGREMNAQYTLLTHFSKDGYSGVRLPTFSDSSEQVGIAFDNMKVCFKDLPTLRHLYSPLKALFTQV